MVEGTSYQRGGRGDEGENYTQRKKYWGQQESCILVCVEFLA
jgi:hypothetical protein